LLGSIAISDAASNDTYGDARAFDARIAMMDRRVDRDSITPVHIDDLQYEPIIYY